MIYEDPSGLPYSTIAARLGISRQAIYVMKAQQKEKFMYIKGLHPNFEEGFRKYRGLQYTVTEQVQAIYYALEDRRLLSAFSVHLYNLGLYGSPVSWVTSARNGLFKPSTDSISHKGLMKKIRVVQAYESFPETKIKIGRYEDENDKW